MEGIGERVIDLLLGLSDTTVYVLVAVLCWSEAAFFLGFVTPGEIAVATGGVLAHHGRVTLAGIAGAAALGTVVGNSTGYWLGRRWGTPILEGRTVRRFLGPAVEEARAFLERRGEWAIVLGRLATFTRIVVPFLAGASRMSYRRFLTFDLPTSVAWAVTWASVGFALGESWRALSEIAGTAAVLVLILFVLALAIRWVAVRVARNRRRIEAAGRLFLTVSGLRALDRRLRPFADWMSRRFDPRFSSGLGLTIAFVVLFGSAAGVGVVVDHSRAVSGLALMDFPALEWMVDVRTDAAVEVARQALWAFHWPGALFLAVPLASLLVIGVGRGAALRCLLGVAGAGLGAFLLDRHVLEGVVPRAEFPSVPVAVAGALLVHLTAAAAARRGWGLAVAAAATGVFFGATVGLATLVAGWAAPSGIALGFALGVGWATALELQPLLLRAADADEPPGRPAAPPTTSELTGPAGSPPPPA